MPWMLLLGLGLGGAAIYRVRRRPREVVCWRAEIGGGTGVWLHGGQGKPCTNPDPTAGEIIAGDAAAVYFAATYLGKGDTFVYRVTFLDGQMVEKRWLGTF